VLHGGSGVRTAQLREAVRAGIRKVNISTEIHAAFARALADGIEADPRPALRRARAAVADAAAARIEVLGAAQRA
jgi:fructose-bisphosphate aldolase class II